ncbi:MAG TPA: DUF1622 domain-containing protein [Chloroflexota bacterium]|nr:DUF1622 domain-containing protein [Chloroflexota bacterium]
MPGLVAFTNIFTNSLASTIDSVALLVEIGGVIAVLIAMGNALAPFLLAVVRAQRWPGMAEVRRRLGRGLVLSLQIFVAADLLRTLANPGLQEVIILGAIAVLRTILGFNLEYELRHLPGSD